MRSRRFLWGLPNLDDKFRAQLLEANRVVRNTLKILDLIIEHNISFAVGNPQSPKLWQLQHFRRHLKHGRYVELDTDFCAYGMPWRKRTPFYASGFAATRGLDSRCCGRHGLCSFSGKHHIQLRGSLPGHRLNLTKEAEPYPH